MEGRLTPNILLTKPDTPRTVYERTINSDLDLIDQAVGALDGRIDVLEAGGGGGGGGPPTGPAGGDLSGSYPNPQIAAGVITDADVNALNKDGLAAVPSLRTLGTGPQQATAGNDARLTNARAPTAHATTHQPGGTDAMTVDAAAATGSLRTLSTTATSAAAGNHTHGAAAPAAHATTHQPGGADAMAVDAAAGTGSLRTLGAGAQQAAGGTHTHGAAAPAAHATTHQPGGSDALAVDAVAATGSLRTLGTGAQQAAVGSHAHAGSLTNPMTTLEDIIKAGAAGVPLRLAVGAEGQILGVTAGVVGWTAPPPVANLLTNPGAEIWQRGPGAYTANGAYTADRWQIFLVGGAAMSVVQDTTNYDAAAGGQYCMAVTYTHGSSSGSNLINSAGDYYQVRSRTITFSVRVKTSTPNAVRAGVWDGTYHYGAFHTGGGGYETLTHTATVPSNVLLVQCLVNFDATCTAYVDSAVLVVGSSAPPYTPLHPTDEITRCQRYYFEIGGLDPNEFLVTGQAVSATSAQLVLRYPVEMLDAPTVTASAPGDWQVFNAGGGAIACTAVNVGLITRRSCRIQAVVAAGLVAGDAVTMRANSTTAARLRFEKNP